MTEEAIRVLVVGAGGQLASELLAQTQEKGLGGWTFLDATQCDIRSRSACQEAVAQVKPQWIVNCAAYTAVDAAEENKELAYAINDTGVDNLLHVATAHAARLIHISTDYVFGDHPARPISELDIPSPQGVYAQSKRAGEVRIIDSPYALLIRTSWLYSPYGRNFYLTMRSRAEQGVDSRVVADQFGAPTSATTLASAIIHIVYHPAWHPGILHLCDAGVASWYDFAHAIYQLSQSSATVTPIRTEEYPTPAPRPHFSLLDCRQIETIYQFKRSHWMDTLTQCHNHSSIHGAGAAL